MFMNCAQSVIKIYLVKMATFSWGSARWVYKLTHQGNPNQMACWSGSRLGRQRKWRWWWPGCRSRRLSRWQVLSCIIVSLYCCIIVSLYHCIIHLTWLRSEVWIQACQSLQSPGEDIFWLLSVDPLLHWNFPSSLSVLWSMREYRDCYSFIKWN